ncbi:C39 family peptidase [Glycomyces sp. YM15]|uniref:C39 family peptidase n=1 Tax=Glycomyces sp. YM15 TaxID=2800446 RepID=UPI001963E4C1|nr:C39 family peptidase [Glycomyces sp. YM15]
MTLLLAALVAAMAGVIAAASPAQAATYGPYTAKVNIDARGSMDPNDRTATDWYTAGQGVYIQCQDWGMAAGGSTLWDYTAANWWIPDAYLTTGHSGRVPGVPLCSDLGIDGTPAGVGFSAGPYKASTAIDGRGSMDPDDRVKTDAYLSGANLYVKCQDYGLSAGGSTLWIYTTDGYWVPDAYVTTGTSGMIDGAPRCISIGINGTPSGTGANSGPYPVKFALDGRGSPDPDDRVRVDAYPDGSSLYIRCQDTGVSTGGSTLWDYTTDGYWVPDAYVTTGIDGRISGVPLCSSIGIGGGSGGGSGTQFKIRTNLNGYYEKSLSSGNVWDKYTEGSYVTIMCQAYGEVNYGGSAIWDLTSDGLWIPDYYVVTGSSSMVMTSCDGDSPSGSGNRFLVKETLNGYNGKSLTSTYVLDKYPAGSYVTITCQAYGEFNYGGYAVWDYTSDGLWIADYYVSTGSTDIIMNRCDSDPKPSGGSGNPTVPSNPATGSVPTSEVRDRIVNAAYSQLGTQEWGDNCNPYGNGGVKCGDPWCSMFASWTWQQAGIDVYFPYSGTFETWGKNRGLMTSKSNIEPGDVVIYGTSYYDSDHIGVVVDVDPVTGNITTIEGNYGNKVTMVTNMDPHNPGPVHSYNNIYAVVSPVADANTNWTSGSSLVDESDFGNASDNDICTGVKSASGMQYQLCLEGWVTTPSSTYGAYNNTRYRGRLSVVYDDNSSSPSHGAVQAAVDLYVPGNGWGDGRCVSSLLADGKRRDCYTEWLDVADRGASVLDATVTINGEDQNELRVTGLPMVGYRQETSTYCGPATVKSAAMTMRASSAPSQSSIADQMKTDTYGFTYPGDMASGWNAFVPTGLGYSFYDWYSASTSGTSMELQVERIREHLDNGQPSSTLVQYGYLPWGDPTADTSVRHYMMIYGYSASYNASGTNTNWPVTAFQVWDSASAKTYTITVDDLIYASQTAAGVGGFDVIAPNG